jgi:hypothetical protein
MRRIVVWTPRILGLLFAAFIGLFALDVFGAGYGFWETIAGFLIHLIPTAIILAAVALAWRRPWVGAILFFALGVWYLVTAWGQFPWTTYLIVAGPAFLVGVLFLISWLVRPGPHASFGPPADTPS